MNLDADDGLETSDKNGSKPLLIYDGVCGFCTYWATYWQKLTGDSVRYVPYQDGAANYPEIPVTVFQNAVQYISTDGQRASAAEASFLTLSHARNNHFWLRLYRRLPGFAFVSEKTYAFIAAHRSFFYFLSVMLWGREHEPPRYALTSWLFLRAFGLIYLAAFISFGIEALGLIGSHGIIPLTELINGASSQLGSERYWIFPMLFWLNASDAAIQALCLSGVGFSLLLIFNVLPRLSLLALYILYLSLCCAGQLFMNFQWDMLLLETGILAFFLLGSQVTGIWLLRWLLFRFMFVSGMVKIMSGEPAWQNLSTLSYYFLTEPLPTPLAWFAAHLPQTLLAACTAATLFIELITPFLIFFPRRLRFIAAFSILLLQTTILITGNYNFFNLLTMLLCLTLFDDAALKKIIPEKITRLIPQKIYILSRHKITVFITWMFVSLTILLSVVGFNLRFGFSSPSAPIMRIYNSVAPLRIVNTYGPFSVITKERNEIIIEGSDDSIHWREYTFKYKPGDINRRPLWNIPLQPRLDWQLWFAALDTANNTPWFERFMQRLLENSPAVIALLESSPFPNKPPRYVRAELYDYQFTTSEEKAKTGAWWKRELIWLYFSPVQLLTNS